jgi:hypothetical protein
MAERLAKFLRVSGMDSLLVGHAKHGSWDGKMPCATLAPHDERQLN